MRMTSPAALRAESEASDPESSGDAALVRVLGVRGLAAHIFNITIGGGIFVLPAIVAAGLGPAAPIAYVVCAVGMGLIVLCFADAGSRVSLTGGPYAYVETALGSFTGFIAGVLLWLTGCFATASVATAFAGSLGVLIPGAGTGIARAAVLVLLFVVLATVNIRGARQGTRLIEIVTVAKLIPLLVFIAAGAAFIRGDNLALSAAPATFDVMRMSLLLIFAFAGVESALVPSGEIRDTARTVPRALFIAMLSITLLYLAIQLVAQGLLGADLARFTDAPLAEAAGRVMGPFGAWLLLAGATVSMFGYVSGMTLSVPRALFAFGRDGFLPSAVGAVHPRFRTPHVAIAIQSAIVLALAVTGTFARLAIIANVALLLLYLLCCVAAFELRRRDVRSGGGGTPFNLPAGAGWVAPPLAIAVILVLLLAAEPGELALVAGVLLVATALYVLAWLRRPRAGIAT